MPIPSHSLQWTFSMLHDQDRTPNGNLTAVLLPVFQSHMQCFIKTPGLRTWSSLLRLHRCRTNRDNRFLSFFFFFGVNKQCFNAIAVMLDMYWLMYRQKCQHSDSWSLNIKYRLEKKTKFSKENRFWKRDVREYIENNLLVFLITFHYHQWNNISVQVAYKLQLKKAKLNAHGRVGIRAPSKMMEQISDEAWDDGVSLWTSAGACACRWSWWEGARLRVPIRFELSSGAGAFARSVPQETVLLVYVRDLQASELRVAGEPAASLW